jgi:phosphopantothenoylcysteine decarboxylase/phosphopantothenate--cysteine ligase
LKLLVTAGPTCEDIDDVRCITNRSSGRMGLAVAAEALRRGHQVELVLGPTELEPPAGARVTPARSAEDMLRECRALFPDCAAAVMTAAIADYRPAERFSGKMKKSDGEVVIRLVPTPDVSVVLGEIKQPGQVIVGFALESSDPAEARRHAEAKMAAKKQDFAVLNGPAALGALESEVSFLAAGGGWSEPEKLSKAAIAGCILDFIEEQAQR